MKKNCILIALVLPVACAFAGNDLAALPERPTGELQEKAQALADLAVKEGMQGALQFCAFKDGKCIVDVWAVSSARGIAKFYNRLKCGCFCKIAHLTRSDLYRIEYMGC